MIKEISKPRFYIEGDGFTAYEFHTPEDVYIEEAETETDYFRLEIVEEGEPVVLVANEDEWCIHEDVTHKFDVQAIIDYCKKHHESFFNATVEYENYVIEND